MNSQLFIPTKINVGYQERSDTYTKRLAYVIYYDNKNVLRKEASWQSWRDKKLGNDEFDNKPTEGFVLNKKAGGYSSGWNHRQTYCRVYDPRGFEFEITIPNLLFILQEASSFKGKGLDGEFVYAWDGKDLVLLPVGSEDYKKCTEFTKLQSGKVSVKELVPGGSYKTKQQQDLIYLGKFDYYEYKYSRDKATRDYKYKLSVDKKHIFVDPSNSNHFYPFSGLTTFASINSTTPVSNYADLMDAWNKSKYSAGIKGLVEKPATFEIRPLASYEIQSMQNYPGHADYFGHDLKKTEFYKKEGDVYYGYSISVERESDYKNGNYHYTFKGYKLNRNTKIETKGKELIKEYVYNSPGYFVNQFGNKIELEQKLYSLEELSTLGLCNLCVETENRGIINIENYN